MAIPLFYNLRNLMIRKTTTVMTGLGITLSVAMVNGLRTVIASTGILYSFWWCERAALRN
jgi:hypothetical protein